MSHKTKCGFEGFRHCVARVKDPVAKGDVRQKSTAVVYLIDGENHGLEPTETTEIEPGETHKVWLQIRRAFLFSQVIYKFILSFM